MVKIIRGIKPMTIFEVSERLEELRLQTDKLKQKRKARKVLANIIRLSMMLPVYEGKWWA